MDSPQLIYPTIRLLANPRTFMAVANYFLDECDDAPDWETLRDAVYDLLEGEFEDQEVEPRFDVPEVCFRVKPDDPEVYQVVLSNGNAIELRPTEGGGNYMVIESEEELGVASVIYRRLVKAIEEKRPDLAGDISLNDIPMLNNGFLRDARMEIRFQGDILTSLSPTPRLSYGFVVNVV